VVDDEKDVKRAKPDRLDSKQIAGPDLVGVLGAKLPPPGRRLAAPRSSHVLGDRAGANSEAKLGELGLNALLAPK